jgi:hypothetical protein
MGDLLVFIWKVFWSFSVFIIGGSVHCVKLQKKPYGFNDKVGTKKSNAKKYINDKL